MVKFIPFSPPYIGNEEIKAVTMVLKSGWLSHGPLTEKFEKKFAKYVNAKFAISVNSCTSGLFLSLAAINTKNGDEVITTPLTFAATANVVHHLGARPVFADICEDTYNIDPVKIEEKITRKTKAIIPVHYAGQPCDMNEITKIAKDNNLTIIEDAAHATGSEYEGKMIGSLGNLTCFSFYVTKPITCFPPHTRIVTKPLKGVRGKGRSKHIQNIRVGDEVLTYNQKTGIKEYKRVLRTHQRNYKGQIFFIKFSNGNEVQVTPNHPIYDVKNKKWIAVEKLKIGDEVLQYKYGGLRTRLMGISQRGKTKEQIFGKYRANNILRKVSLAVRGKNHPLYGTKMSRITKEKIAKALSGRTLPVEFRQKMSEGQKRRYIRKGEKERHLKIMKKYLWSEESKMKATKTLRKLWKTDSYREKQRIIQDRLRKNPEYWRKYSAGLNLRPNKLEQKIMGILNNVCPGEFAYNGDYSLGITIDGLIPDFVNINGKKKVIDVLGLHWHKQIEQKQRIKRFKKTGWDSLIVWENEVKDEQRLIEKIKRFIYNPNIEIVQITGIRIDEYNGSVYNLTVEDNNNYFAYGILFHNCGEGGMITTNNKKMAERLKVLGRHGISRDAWKRYGSKGSWYYEVLEAGYKFNTTDINSALGLVQMKRLKWFEKKRKEIFDYYTRELEGLDVTTPIIRPNVKTSYHLYPILLEGYERNRFIDDMKASGIGTSVHFIPLHLQPFYRRAYKYKKGDFPVAEEVYRKIVSLPIYPQLKKSEFTYIISTIKRILNK